MLSPTATMTKLHSTSNVNHLSKWKVAEFPPQRGPYTVITFLWSGIMLKCNSAWSAA